MLILTDIEALMGGADMGLMDPALHRGARRISTSFSVSGWSTTGA
jgi:hypothetical protein